MNSLFTNRYDRLSIKPAFEKEDLLVEQEELAQMLFNSGLLRVSADDKCNFVIYPVLGGKKHLNFSKKELYNEKLLPQTKQIISEYLAYDERKNAEENTEKKVEILRNKLAKYIEVPEAYEIKLCRLLVQSAHNAVIRNMIDDNVKFFISYNYNISDLLDVGMWQTSKSSSGLQSTDYKNSSVFVSCGGNPFFDPKESNSEQDGMDAVSRLMIVAAQEIAHYSDIVKDKTGKSYGRFSTTPDGRYPNAECQKYRLDGLKKCDEIENKLKYAGAFSLYQLEQRLQIQKRYKKFSVRILFLQLRILIVRFFFLRKCEIYRLSFIKFLKNRKYIAEESLICFYDMKFNLEPKADAYRDKNKNIEKATACAEALARIPQQELKWSKGVVKFFSKELQDYFYYIVINEEIARFYEKFGKKYQESKTKFKKPLLDKMVG